MSKSAKNNLSTLWVARIIFIVIIAVGAVWYYISLPKPPAADFSLLVPTAFDLETADPGGPTVKEIRIESKGGFSSLVTLSLGALPSGVTATLSSASVTPPPNGVATVTISFSASVAATGTHNIEVRAVSGDKTYTKTIQIRIVNFVPP